MGSITSGVRLTSLIRLNNCSQFKSLTYSGLQTTGIPEQYLLWARPSGNPPCYPFSSLTFLFNPRHHWCSDKCSRTGSPKRLQIYMYIYYQFLNFGICLFVLEDTKILYLKEGTNKKMCVTHFTNDNKVYYMLHCKFRRAN